MRVTRHKANRRNKKRTTRKIVKRTNKRGGGTDIKVVYTLTSGCGFFSTFFQLCRVYIYAKKNSYPFFIKHNEWQYTYKEGWHDYFTSLQTYNDVDGAHNVQFYTTTAELDKLPVYTMSDYMEAIKEVYILKPEIQEYINTKIKEYGEYKSIYIRRGDKHTEFEIMTIDSILPQTDIINEPSKLFVQTDDYRAVEELRQKLPAVTVLTETLPSQQGSDNQKLKELHPEERKKDTEQLFKSIGIYLGASKCWSYVRSNITIFHKLYAPEKVHIYVDSGISKENVSKVFEPSFQGHPYLLVDYMK